MKLRVLAIFALVLVAAAIGAWVWFGADGAQPGLPDGSRKPGNAEIARIQPAVDVPVPDSPAARATGTPEPPPQALKPVEPVRITSSVTPGMPMARTTDAPSRPRRTEVPVSVPGAVLRPERQIEGKAELSQVQSMFRDFRARIGENPVGTNAEIMKAVMGGNRVSARLGPPEGQSVNEQGELVDKWGTPYFFHQLSKDSMEVRSAGPDRVMWTPDDLVAK